MASHLRPITEDCRVCKRPAQYRLYNTVNAPMGAYCRRHAVGALRDWRKAQGEPPPTAADLPA